MIATKPAQCPVGFALSYGVDASNDDAAVTILLCMYCIGLELYIYTLRSLNKAMHEYPWCGFNNTIDRPYAVNELQVEIPY